MKIRGHSNFDVILNRTNKGNFFVRKSRRNKSENQRLKNQYTKQKVFSYDSNLIITPKIINTGIKNDVFYFDMEYFDCLSFGELFEKRNYKTINGVFNIILNFIEENISLSKEKDITSILKEKYQSVKTNIKHINNNLDFETIDIIFDGAENIKVPIGSSHGDLTFSNILFDNKIIFIDFLDSFIESPLNDIVKLRQDTLYKWSIDLLTEKRDITKLKLIFDELDKIIINKFAKYEFYKNHYDLFQLLNFLRILQYSKDKNTILYLQKNIKKICHNLIYEYKTYQI